MTVPSTNLTTASLASLPAAERLPQKTLGQQDYFKLLAVQFSTQDPLKPMDDTSFIAELANFSALENSAKLASEFERFADQQVINSAHALLGRAVTIEDPVAGGLVTGIVSSVRSTAAGPRITVGGADFEVTSVRRVELADAFSATNSTQP